jgi:hypothetical protein
MVHLQEIEAWLSGLESMNETLTGGSNLECTEPNLGVTLTIEQHGRMLMTVDLTPEYQSQQHRFLFDLDQSYLAELIGGCKGILMKYPLVGKNESNG